MYGRVLRGGGKDAEEDRGSRAEKEQRQEQKEETVAVNQAGLRAQRPPRERPHPNRQAALLVFRGSDGR